MSDIEVRVPRTEEDMSEFSEVMRDAWDGMPDSEVIPSHVFEASRETGNVLGAYMDGELIGFAYQIPDTEEQGLIHSHAVGVTSDHAGEGVGEQIKRGQRQHALDRGFDKIEWTYDPLLGMNANLNIGKLGGKVSEYREDVYDSENGTTAGETPADRFVVEWDLDSDHVERTLEGEENSYDPGTVISAQGPDIDLEDSTLKCLEGGYKLREVPEGAVAVQIPRDRSVAEEAGTEEEWRYATREVFQTLFDDGYEVIDFQTESHGNTYILEH